MLRTETTDDGREMMNKRYSQRDEEIRGNKKRPLQPRRRRVIRLER